MRLLGANQHSVYHLVYKTGSCLRSLQSVELASLGELSPVVISKIPRCVTIEIFHPMKISDRILNGKALARIIHEYASNYFNYLLYR